VQQQLHMPPASISHMFCNIVQATSSSQEQVIFMPPWHFSIFISHRGTMHMLPIMGDMVGMLGMVEPLIAAPPVIMDRSNIIIVDIISSIIFMPPSSDHSLGVGSDDRQ
jgi:hypothetical protein